MQNLVAKITRGTRLRIGERLLRVEAKSIYVTQSDPESAYAKAFLEGGHVLVLSPKDGHASFGEEIGSMAIDPPFSEEITYQGALYKLVDHDYQIVLQLEFGDPLETEGEVEFWDYEGVSNPDRIISVGIVQRTGDRADVIADVLSDFREIAVEQEEA